MSLASRVKMKLFFSPQSTRVISFQFSRVSSHHKLNWAAKSQSNKIGEVAGRWRRKSFGANQRKKCFCALEAQSLYKGVVCDEIMKMMVIIKIITMTMTTMSGTYQAFTN